ncbi:MAG: trypsin-like serine protease [Planctomycetota bacterium]|nr:trypsin-like serine protease [Planctomycetota bacterium]
MSSKLYDEAVFAVGRYLKNYSGVVFDKRSEQLFNGVFILHEGRHFLGTAAHCLEHIDRAEDFSGLHIMTMRRRFGMSAALPMATTYSLPTDHYDVGVLEFSDDLATSLGASWIDETSASSAEAQIGRHVCSVGTPGTRTSDKEVLGHRVTELQPDFIVSSITERDASRLSDYNSDVDILVEWPDKARDKDGRPTAHCGTFAGMSGSGVFLIPPMHEGRVWSPSETELVGIFTSQYPETRLWKFQRIELLFEAIRIHIQQSPPLR